MSSIKPVEFAAGLLIAGSWASADVTFAPPALIDTPGATADLRVVDLDGDGDLDIAALEVDFSFEIGEAAGMINIALNDGAGGFAEFSTFSLGTFPALENAFNSLVSADLDNDGDTDLASIGTTSPLLLLFNDGQGTFSDAVNTGISVSLGPLRALVDAGDLDGDGDVDLALGLPGQVATNDGSGSFIAAQFTDDSNPMNLEIVDVDSDGDEDIAFGFRIHLNDGAGAFTQQEGIYPGTGAIECVFADFDGDDDPDVACAANFVDTIRIAPNNGDGSFAPFVEIQTMTSPIDLHTGRFDEDDDLDLLLTHSSGNEIIAIYTGNGDGTFNDAIILPSPDGTMAAVGDLNGDGLTDVVMSTGFVFSPNDEPIAVLLNEGGAAILGDLDKDGIVGAADLAILLGAWNTPDADLNGDGTTDPVDLGILLGNWGTGSPAP